MYAFSDRIGKTRAKWKTNEVSTQKRDEELYHRVIQGMEATFFVCAKSFNETSIPVKNGSTVTYIRGRKVYEAAVY